MTELSSPESAGRGNPHGALAVIVAPDMIAAKEVKHCLTCPTAQLKPEAASIDRDLLPILETST
jgi:hypothetical protein